MSSTPSPAHSRRGPLIVTMLLTTAGIGSYAAALHLDAAAFEMIAVLVRLAAASALVAWAARWLIRLVSTGEDAVTRTGRSWLRLAAVRCLAGMLWTAAAAFVVRAESFLTATAIVRVLWLAAAGVCAVTLFVLLTGAAPRDDLPASDR